MRNYYGGTEAPYRNGGAEVGHYIIMEARRHGVQEQMLDMAYGATETWCGRGADVVRWAWNYRNMVWTGSRCGTLGMELQKHGVDGQQMWDSH